MRLAAARRGPDRVLRGEADRSRTVLVAHPAPDVYGSDLQLLESVTAMVAQGWRVVVALPGDGPLVPLLRERGATELPIAFPVVRKQLLSAGGLLRLAGGSAVALARIHRAIRRLRPCAVYVNTMTIPWWLLAARVAGTPCLCHVHEAETDASMLVRTALYAPLVLADRLAVNSRTAVDAMCAALPRLQARTRVVYNGVAGPPGPPSLRPRESGCFRLAVIGRLSPRKAPDVALEAVALLRAEGRQVHLEVCGTAFAGYEWYVEELRERASRPDLTGAVTFSGHVSPVWPVLERCHAVVAPSLGEPFGNAVVEAQLAMRPVVASAAFGHLETVSDEHTGLLVAPDDPAALARAVARLIDDEEAAAAVATAGRHRALERFSTDRYHEEIVAIVHEARSRTTTMRFIRETLLPLVRGWRR